MLRRPEPDCMRGVEVARFIAAGVALLSLLWAVLRK